MSEQPVPIQVERKIPSEHGAAQAVLNEIVAAMRAQCWPVRDVFAVQLAVHEALVNAIVHGNRRCAEKQVHVAWRLMPEELLVSVTDEGLGFDPQALPDCTHPDRLDAPGGRGVALMRSFMDRVEFRDQGRSVVLVKKRSAAQTAAG